jgi:hypothetical protein
MLYVKSPYSNGLSTHTRMVLGWHTGVEIGGNPSFGGTRFMNDSPGVSTTELMGVGVGDQNVRIANTLFVPYIADRDNTAFYLNPADTGTSINIAGSLRAANFNRPAILSVASGTGSSGGSLAIQQETAEGWTGIFVDYEPNTGWGLWHDNPNNMFAFTGEGSTGQIRSFTVPSRVSGNRTAFEKFRVDQNNGDVIVGRDGYAQASFRAPIFYDNNNTGYYIDGDNTSNLWVLRTHSYQGNSNVGGTGAASWHPSGIYSAGFNWLYGGIEMAGGTLSGVGPIFSTIYYDRDNTGFYTDPASTSVLNVLNVQGNLNAHAGIVRLSEIRFTDTAGSTASDPYTLRWISETSARGAGNSWLEFQLNDDAGEEIRIYGNSCVGFGCGVYSDNLYHRFRADGYAWHAGTLEASGDMRSPIFYDLNNTGYYLDPTSGGVALRLSGAIQGDHVGWTGEHNKIQWHSSHMYFQNMNNGFWLFRRSNGAEPFQLHADGYGRATGDWRAPIFYDDNNTAFYGDFASTSRIVELRARKMRGDTNDSLSDDQGWWTHDPYGQGWGKPHGSFRTLEVSTSGNFSTEPAMFRIHQWGSGAAEFWKPQGTTLFLRETPIGSNIKHSNWFTRFFVQRYIETDEDMRAPIFYDANNTNYYSDPASTSVYNVLRFGTSTNSGRFDGEGTWGVRFRTNDGYIWLGPANTGHAHIYTDRPNFYFNVPLTVNDGSYINTGDIRSAIFYDRNDTTYYTDLNGGSYVRGRFEVAGGHGDSTFRLTARGNEMGTGTPSYLQMWVSEPGVTWNDGGFGFNVQNDGGGPGGFGRINGGQGQAYMRFTTGGNLLFYNTNTSGTRFSTMDMYSDNWIYAHNYLTGGNSLRAPLFYDSNDTSFYFNGNGDSRWQGLDDYSKMRIGLTGRGNFRRNDYTGDTGYWVGSMGWGTTDMNTVASWGSGFIDSWSNPGNQPSGTSHWVGTQAFHYAYGGNSNTGWQLVGGPISNLRFRNAWGGWSGWTTVAMHDRNDGSGGALYAGMYYDANDTGYYLDPNSGAANCLRVVGGIHVSVGNTTGNGIILADDGDIVDLNDGYCAMRFSFGVRIHSANRGGGPVIALREFGGIIAADNITAYGSPSDARKKENIVPIENALEKVTKLRGVEFDWRENTDEWIYTKIKHDIGFIAQEVQEVEPKLVREGGDGFLGLRDRAIPALLVEAIKELKAELDEARNEIKQLREEILKK